MSGYLQDLAKGFQETLVSRLKAHRLALTHPVAKGTASENEWVEVLKMHLPKRYDVDSGFVVDSRGTQSEQIDLVIYDRQYAPLLYNRQGQRVLPAESVYAVFEVKQQLGRRRVQYAGKKAASVRGLHRTAALAEGMPKARDPIRPLAGVLTYESAWKEPYGEPFCRVIGELDEQERLDLGCIVKAGSFEVRYDKEGNASISSGPRDRALVDFFLRLVVRLQELGTAPPAKYSEYARSLGLE